MERTDSGDLAFPVVGIGASAGGLEALELFLAAVPQDSGMAYVIVQHLDPTHEGMLVELLQRVTRLEVSQVKDGVRVRPNHVYVIPPNRDLAILRGALQLLEPVAPRGLRLPIDFFFRALAVDRGERAVGVILSGMGTDGTLGIRAIKARGGAVFAQDPATARFDGMPLSAVESGVTDVIASAGDLPGRIAALATHATGQSMRGLAGDDTSQGDFDKVILLLRAQTGQDFSLYKKHSVLRRIERRMGIHQLDRLGAYVRLLQENPHEIELLFKELLIGVTSFFRDPAAWDAIATTAIPSLLKQRPVGKPLRVWIPGCSTGEEAYSLAIVVREVLEASRTARSQTVQIFATDLDPEAIERARVAVFPANIVADVSPERLSRHFVEVDRGYQVSKSVRESVIFATQNVIMDPPFTRLDLVCCRNLLIYLTPELQDKLLPLFHFALNPGGFLLLGSAETVGRFTHLFASVKGKARLYQRLEPRAAAAGLEFPSRPTPPAALQSHLAVEKPEGSLQAHAERVILERFSFPAVLVNTKGDILYVSGRTGRYLEPAAGKANWNVLAMVRDELRYGLTDAFRKAMRMRGSASKAASAARTISTVDGVQISVHPLGEPDALRGLALIVFRDLPPVRERPPAVKGRKKGTARERTLEAQVTQARQELRAAREEMRSSQEVLQSTNEELQSANEELQSTNEELTTSREEMQSMNEELHSLNHEMQSKVEALSQLNNDLKNLLDSTDLATIFVDTSLRVRLHTAGVTRIFRLIPGDVGRPITDIASDLSYPELASDARAVLHSLAVRERVVSSRDGGHFHVRVAPYRTLENVIDGVVLTFADVSVSAALEASLRKTQVQLEQQLAVQSRQLEDAGVAPPSAADAVVAQPKAARPARPGRGRTLP